MKVDGGTDGISQQNVEENDENVNRWVLDQLTSMVTHISTELNLMRQIIWAKQC
jgi:hypothetical protein